MFLKTHNVFAFERIQKLGCVSNTCENRSNRRWERIDGFEIEKVGVWNKHSFTPATAPDRLLAAEVPSLCRIHASPLTTAPITRWQRGYLHMFFEKVCSFDWFDETSGRLSFHENSPYGKEEKKFF